MRFDREEYEVSPNIIVYLGQEKSKHGALVDSGVDLNVISYKTWLTLKSRPNMTSTKLKVSTFVGEKKGIL